MATAMMASPPMCLTHPQNGNPKEPKFSQDHLILVEPNNNIGRYLALVDKMMTNEISVDKKTYPDYYLLSWIENRRTGQPWRKCILPE